MKNLSKTFPLLFFFIGLTTTTLAQTQALVISSTTQSGKDKTFNSKMYLAKDKMLAETQQEQGKSVVLYDAGAEMLYVIDHKKKEYTEMSRQDLQALNAMLSQQLQMLEQQLEMMPENQRKLIKEKMGAAFSSTAEPVNYELEASAVEVSQWETDKYVGTVNGKKQNEIYIATYDELGREAEDFQALKSFFTLVQEQLKGMSKMMSSAGLGFFSENMPAYQEGIPVKALFFNEEGQVSNSSMLENISEETVEESLFRIPEDYKKKEMMR